MYSMNFKQLGQEDTHSQLRRLSSSLTDSEKRQ